MEIKKLKKFRWERHTAQNYCNGFDQRVAGQRLTKHGPKGNK
jgi:hypothetical protein